MGTEIQLYGRLVSTYDNGKKAQIIVTHGAYKGTYHCHWQDGQWKTTPNYLGDQKVLVVEAEPTWN